MSTRDDGDSAFPQAFVHPAERGASGLTKREWFAGQALIGLLAAKAPSITDIPASALRPLAQTAARIADAIIEELKE